MKKKAFELNIGDVVKLSPVDPSAANREMTVINKTKEEITFFRPYVSLADFTYTGGVIPYIGMEKFNVSLESPCEYIVIENIFREKK